MQDRDIKISVADSHASKSWKQQTLTFCEFVNDCRQWRVIDYSHANYINLPNDQQRSLKNVGGYVFGSLDETGFRKKEHLLTREGITFDLDDIDGNRLSEISLMLTKSGLNYLLHSTASYDGYNMKTRVIIPFSEPIKPEDYELISKNVALMLGVPLDDDVCSFEDTHMMYWPTKLKDINPIFIYQTDGEYLNPNDHKTAPEAHLEGLAYDSRISDLQSVEAGVIEPIAHVEAIEIMKQYVKRDYKNLQDRENYVNAFMVVTKAFQTGEIEYGTGAECVKLLACGNAQWEADNLDHYKREIRRTQPRTEYTFRTKFDWNRIDVHELFGKQESTNAGDLVQTTFSPITQYIKDMIVPGLTIIAAPPKSGKSWYVLAMCLALTTGQKFLDRESIISPTLYLALEDSPRRIQNRILTLEPSIQPEALTTLDIAYNAPHIQLPDNSGKYHYERTINNDLLKNLDYWYKEHNKRIFVVDVFQKVRPGTGNKNQYEAEYKEGALLQQWAKERRACLILIHHFKKGTAGQDPVERIGGSTGITGAADTLMTIERIHRSDDKATFTVTGRDVSWQEFECSFNNGIWTYEGTTDDNIELAKKRSYENNPIVKTIRYMLTDEKEFRATASELKAKMLELYEWEADGIKVDKRVIEQLQNMLYLYDGIGYEYKKSGQNWHIFTSNSKPADDEWLS